MQGEDAFFGPYELFRDRVKLGAEPAFILSAGFSVTDGELRFTDMTGGECVDAVIWTTNPWVAVEESGAEALVGSWSTTFDEVSSSESTLGTYTMLFRNDGTMQFFDPSGEVGYHGDYTVFRDHLEIVGDPDTVSTNFTIEGDELTFTGLTVPGCDDCEPYKLTWEFQPWVRN
jgi:hypothetical protein